MSTETPETAKRDAARCYIDAAIRAAIENIDIDGVEKLLPHAGLAAPLALKTALAAARQSLVTAQQIVKESTDA